MDGQELQTFIDRYNVAWNAHDVEAIVNMHTDDHVFHIHTNPFQVTKMNGKPLAVPQWRDTAIVERLRDNQPGTLTFRSRFLDYIGIYMLHCHMMNHEEMGMMQTVEVYK